MKASSRQPGRRRISLTDKFGQPELRGLRGTGSFGEGVRIKGLLMSIQHISHKRRVTETRFVPRRRTSVGST